MRHKRQQKVPEKGTSKDHRDCTRMITDLGMENETTDQIVCVQLSYQERKVRSLGEFLCESVRTSAGENGNKFA